MSVLKEAIAILSDNHNLKPWIDSNKKRQRVGKCPLSSGIEYSFVANFCQEIFQDISLANRADFHKFFFIPNLKAEAKVGYDLSIGYYCQNNRIRSMHKVINEKYCDQPWTYRFNYARNERGEFTGDYGHFIKLLNANPEDLEAAGVNIIPFLVINLCYCIHDYRRMGTLYEQEQITVPAFRSSLRTIIVDIKSLQRQLDHDSVDVYSEKFSLKLSRRPEKRLPNEPSSDYITRITNKTNLRLECSGQSIDPQNVILTFDEFFHQVDWNNLMLILPN